MILPTQHLRAIINGKAPMIISSQGIRDEQIQMATVDTSLGNMVYRMKASALPSSGETVSSLIDRFCAYDFEIKPKGAFLEKGVCYLIPLNESFALGNNYQVNFSPKSSIGRTDTFVRALIDRHTQYDRADHGYKGPLYLEVVPLSFDINITHLLEMIQFRVRTGECLVKSAEFNLMHSQQGILHHKDGHPLNHDEIDMFNDSVYFHIDLDRDIVGFESRSNAVTALDLSKKDFYEVEDFWVPIKRPKNNELVTSPDKFYLFTTRERVKIPKNCCAELMVYDVSAGEYRSHYAGFFDNDFGFEDGGTHVVLEVRPRDVPRRFFHNQRVCRMFFEKTDEIPDKLYGESAGSSYYGPNPSHSKHFKDREAVWCSR